MLTQEAILEAVKAGRERQALDGRDYARLVEFFPEEDLEVFDFKLKEGAEPWQPRPWTEEEVKQQLKADVAFGFRKALDQRGLSASMMWEVVKMWMWVLEDPLQHFNKYARYGLPLLKAVAEKYGFDNPIGADTGDETKYAEF